ncbi:MAG: hypothetical protein H6719_28425 [Sandaracinaceae bacterium]|nr:hypothetical protein [Sandaracinaceae bacterium]
MVADRRLIERPGLAVHAGPPVRLVGDASTLGSIAAAYASIEGPSVPATRERDGALELEVDAVVGLHEVVAHLGAAGRKIGYGVAVAFNERLMDAAEAGHAAGHHLGALAWSSLLCSGSGELWLIGFGLPPALRPAPTEPGACVAPELALGLEASPASDVYVLHAMLRSLVPLCELPASYAEALTPAGRGAPLYAAMIGLAQRALAPDPALRPQNVAALRARYREIRPLAPDMPEADFDGLARTVAEVVSALSGGARVVVEEHARTLTFDGETLDLSRRALLWRLVQRLLEAREAAPGEPVTADQLIEAGWPDERILPEAARGRLYTAIRGLRRGGLEALLWSRDGGYLFDPAVRVERRP